MPFKFLLFSDQFPANPRSLEGFTLSSAKQDGDWSPACANCESTLAADRHLKPCPGGGVYHWTSWAKAYIDLISGDRYEYALCPGCSHRSAERGQSLPFTPTERADCHRRVLAYFASARGGAPEGPLPSAIEGYGRTTAFKPCRDEQTPKRRGKGGSRLAAKTPRIAWHSAAALPSPRAAGCSDGGASSDAESSEGEAEEGEAACVALPAAPMPVKRGIDAALADVQTHCEALVALLQEPCSWLQPSATERLNKATRRLDDAVERLTTKQ